MARFKIIDFQNISASPYLPIHIHELRSARVGKCSIFWFLIAKHAKYYGFQEMESFRQEHGSVECVANHQSFEEKPLPARKGNKEGHWHHWPPRYFTYFYHTSKHGSNFFVVIFNGKVRVGLPSPGGPWEGCRHGWGLVDPMVVTVTVCSPKSPFQMGKLTISTGSFSSSQTVSQRLILINIPILTGYCKSLWNPY